MKYSATIQWTDTEEIVNVLITTDSVEDYTEEEDEDIFFYFDTEEEIKDYMTKDNREFRVLKYEALDCEQEYGVCEKCNTPWDEHEHSCTVNMTQNYNEQTLLQMEQYLEERIAYYKSISLVKSNRDFCFGYGNEQRKVLEEALEYFIKLKNR